MNIGILEFKDNDFITDVAKGLSDLEIEFIRVGEISHPSPSPYSVIIDRVSFVDPFLREVMRYWALTGACVINDPFYSLTADKLSDILVYDRLGILYPKSIVMPKVNLVEDTREMVAEPDWIKIATGMRFPAILKPIDGYGWQDVFRVNTMEELKGHYEGLKGRHMLLLQELIEWREYYRVFCVNRRDILVTKWTPKPFDMGEYAAVDTAPMAGLADFISKKTAELNASVGLDFNSVEWCVSRDGKPYIIDSYNDVPDVRKEKIPEPCYRWIVDRFCACVREKLRTAVDGRDGPGVRKNPRAESAGGLQEKY
jgi:hypothetical protein